MTDMHDENNGHIPVIAAAGQVLTNMLNTPLAPGLYLVSTPIGNLGDISLRALAILAQVDVIYCEDTRHSRKLLNHFGLKTPLQSYHDHNEEQKRSTIETELANNKRIALISDAGTPLISDPGYKLIQALRAPALQASSHSSNSSDTNPDILITAAPGPSAPIMALALSGLATDRFYFEGFLPPKTGQRSKRLEALKSVDATLIFFESANRLPALLAQMKQVFAAEREPEREIVLAKELTKRFERFTRAPLSEIESRLAQQGSEGQRGEYVVLLGPPQKAVSGAEITDAEIRAALTPALTQMRLNDAARQVAQELGIAKKRVYQLGLSLQNGRGNHD